ncbi:hypothetical protein CPHO_10250 [Corynebacterium phocae]|uniref:Type VII secretion-associated protein n=1 Tax=Corynebacterium phocae TaxID=161895 RepID=A0A1L7D4Y8_9CORY|nr:type VII secretion-associated protein [Corynebacterium phocae]APT93208.1 hypothetical protein CPHO_10250 [Corynebacterium phocae]KAA8721946.1 type VII secretion-associated protein [Corynebacterium phocae]
MSDDTSRLTITVLDTATIFEGVESIFRYDLPGSGVVDGWALAGVMDQARKSVGPAWPDVEVEVVTDLTSTSLSEEAVSIIARQLRLVGVKATTAGTGGLPHQAVSSPGASAQPGPVDPAPGTAVPASADPRQPRHAPPRGGRGWPVLPLAAAVVGVLLIAGLAWLLIPRGESPEVLLANPVGVEETGNTSAGSSTSARASTPAGSGPEGGFTAGSSREAEDEREHIRAAGMEFDLPRGFSWTEQDGVITAVGQDPHLRILLVADPTYAVPEEELLKELRHNIDSDDALSQPSETGGTLSYLELPGDGSHVEWRSWVSGPHLMSVGCHSKQAPTVVHRAACRMAAESLSVQG